MTFTFSSHRKALLGLAFVTLVALPGCKKDGDPEVDQIRLTVGTQTITITAAGAVTGAPITVTHGTSVAVSAAFLKADGSAETLVVGPTFRLDVTPAAASVTFTRTGDFAGTINGVTAGSTTVGVALFHVVDGENHMGPFNVAVTVN